MVFTGDALRSFVLLTRRCADHLTYLTERNSKGSQTMSTSHPYHLSASTDKFGLRSAKRFAERNAKGSQMINKSLFASVVG